jgi:hypothetical protein
MTSFLTAVVAAIILTLWQGLPGIQTDGQVARTEVWTLDEYMSQLDAALALLAGDGEPEDALAQAQRLLAETSTVRLRSGDDLRLTPLLEGVTEVSTARQRLLVVREQIALSAGDNSAARLAVLQALLARPEFNRLETLWDRFWRWLREWLARLWPDDNAASPTTLNESLMAALGWAVVIGFGLALVVLLSYWLQAFLAGMVRDSELRRRQQAGAETPLTAATARARATALAESGDFRQAVRHLYLSALLTLEERRLLPVNRSLTNRELLAGAASRQELSAHLAPVVNVFDEVWYGIHEPDQATFRSYAAEIDQLNALARQAEKGQG